MNREDLRLKFKNSGLSYAQIGVNEIKTLERILIRELKDFKNEDDFIFFTMKLSRPRIKDGTKNLTGYIGAKQYVYFHIDGIIDPNDEKIEPFYHFRRREAISFNRDGFIGFAGWADNKNAQPILTAFDKWIDKLKEEQK